MKANAKIVLAGLITTLALSQAQAMRWYSPSTGKWFSRDPIEETGGANLYAFARNDAVNSVDAFGLAVGTIRVLNWSPIVTDSWYKHTRGWLSGLSWSPPTSGGDWGRPCKCKPCQKVIWIQDVRFGTRGSWHQDWGDADYATYGYAWDCNKQGSTDAASFDAPDQHGAVVALFTSPYSFRARSYAKCVQGRDAGATYQTVEWGFVWEYDSTPHGIGPFWEKYVIAGE